MNPKRQHHIVLSCQAAMAQYARSELLTADGQAGEFLPLDEETFLVSTALPFEKLSAVLCKQRPVFIRHIHPADLQTSADPESIAEAAAEFSPEAPFAVQTRTLGAHPALKPFDLNRAVSNLFLARGAELNVREPQQVISITVAENTAYLGFSTPQQNLSAWAGGRMRFAREEGQLSRAEFKLLEAINVFGLQLKKGEEVLDLGAAPGGWSRVCLRRGASVTAVDPAALDESLAGSVHHFRMTAQEFLQQNTLHFDWILNDMRMDPAESAELITQFHPYLRPEGLAVLTLKLFGDQPRRQMLRALARLQDYYTLVGARQLFHNRSEVTVILKK